MARKRYDVAPNGGNWSVKHAGSVLSTHAVKTDAVDAGVRVAKANQPSQLIIHRADGTIEDERTYGDDPRSLPAADGILQRSPLSRLSPGRRGPSSASEANRRTSWRGSITLYALSTDSMLTGLTIAWPASTSNPYERSGQNARPAVAPAQEPQGSCFTALRSSSEHTGAT